MEWFSQLLDEPIVKNMLIPNAELQEKIFVSLIFISLLWIIRFVIFQLVQSRLPNDRVRYTWRKTSTYVAAFIGLLLLGRLWLENIQGIATFLGLASAGLAIALQGSLTDLVGFFLIISRRPFEVGDRIEIGNHAGDVVDIRFLQFTLLEIGNWVHADQSTGRILHIPNRQVFSHTLANYNKGIEYIWHEIEVMITFESNWQKAKIILTQIANQDAAHLSEDAAECVKAAARRFYIVYRNLTPIVYLRVEQSGILLTLRFLVNPRHRRSTEQGIWEDILTAFAQHPDIEFAYPTQRFYSRQAEDKVPPLIKPMPQEFRTVNNNHK